MVVLQVEALPEEILLKIFKLLNKKTLKNVVLSCKA
jgi:hypothetical protein